MSMLEYLKDKLLFIIINLVLFIVILLLLIPLNISPLLIVAIFTVWFLPLSTYILIEFFKLRKYYNEIINICDNLDKKYLLSEIINEPSFIEGKILYSILRDTNRSMRENINYYKQIEKEYEEYIEMWVHEIKTPIASTMLFAENNSENISRVIKDDIKSIENYVEQVLYYSKINNVNKDYIIKEFNLEYVVKNVIRKNASYCISKKISININDLNESVHSDVKWVEFIINQIISNSIKYASKQSPKISIYSKRNKHNTILTIEDNGIGISEKDISKVFEKGFTGENGRIYGKSTGMGLYICEKLCKKLGLNIDIISKINEGTKVNIVFPHDKNRYLYKNSLSQN